jgi:hypothetical protein
MAERMPAAARSGWNKVVRSFNRVWMAVIMGKPLRTIDCVRRLAVLGAVLLGGSAPASNAPPLSATYPAPADSEDRRGNYYSELLELVLAKAGGHFAAVASRDPSTAARVFMRLAKHDGIDVFWGPTTRQLEQDLRAVRIPLDKGILGWRLLLINRGDAARFAFVDSLQQLQRLRAGQADEWSDTRVLRDNGLQVVTASQYSNLAPMLAVRRFDYFPRGVGEITDEARQHPEFVIESHLALHYPVCTYFFVSRDNQALAQEIESGLRRSKADGSFDRLFDLYNGAALRAAGLKERRVLELRNTVEPNSCSDPASGKTGVR